MQAPGASLARTRCSCSSLTQPPLQTGNPDSRSTLRGWILLCLCVDLFPPSVKFELYLLNFLVRSRQCGAARLRSYARGGPTGECLQ